jgi:membrane associated rhomboid family serine protease
MPPMSQGPTLGFATPGKAVRGVMIVTFAIWLTFAIALNWGGAPLWTFELLTGNTEAILRGELWRLFTAPLMHVAQGAGGVSHIVTTLLGLFFLTPRLEETWGGKRILRFIAVSALVGYVLQVLVQLVVPSSLGQRLVNPLWFGLSPALGAIAIAWALTFKNQVVHLFFVLPISSRMLIWIVVGSATLYLIVGAVPPEGLISPYGGMLCGWLLGGGTPSPLRKAWLKLRLAQLGKQSERETRRRPRPNPGGLRVIPGGRSGDSDDENKGPDGRWLN